MHINSYKVIKLILILIALVVGIHAYYGGINLMMDPSGASLNLEQYVNKLPFGNNFYYFGIMLIVFNGLSQIACALLLIMNNNSGGVVATVCASLLLIWTGVQLVSIGWFFYSVLHLIISITQLILGLVFCKVVKLENEKRNKQKLKLKRFQ